MDLDLQKLKSAIQAAYSENKNLVGGANASYIPYLTSVSLNLTGFAVVTVNGDIISVGD